eukprot:5282453-Amphidinium_carterae.1
MTNKLPSRRTCNNSSDKKDLEEDYTSKTGAAGCKDNSPTCQEKCNLKLINILNINWAGPTFPLACAANSCAKTQRPDSVRVHSMATRLPSKEHLLQLPLAHL